MKKTETIQITQINTYLNNIARLAEHNPDYDLSQKELSDTGRIGERIFETVYHPEEITFKEVLPRERAVPAVTENAAAEETAAEDERVTVENTAAGNDTAPAEDAAAGNDTVPAEDAAAENAADSDSMDILVLADREPVGTVISKRVPFLKKLLDENAIYSTVLTLQGGKYKIILPDDTDTLSTEREEAGLFGFLTIEYEDSSAGEPAQETSSDSGFSYISTTYETTMLKEDPGKRGRFLLGLSLILAGGYLIFSGLYWYFARTGKTQLLSVLGGDLPDRLLFPHLGIAAGGVLFIILSLLTKNGVFPFLSALALVGACAFLPGYAAALFLPALFCVFAAFRRRSAKGIVFLKVLSLFAVLGLSGWFLKNTAQAVYSTRRFELLPMWDSVPSGGSSQGEDGYEDDEDYDDFDEDDYDDFDEDGFDDYDDDEDYDDDFDDEDYEDDDGDDW